MTVQSTDVARLVSYKKAYVVSTDLVSIPTDDETPLMLLINPSGSEKKILITHFLVGTDSNSVRSIFRNYCNPTVTTNGTALIPVNTYIGSSPPASDMEVYKESVVSANGDLLNTAILSEHAESRGINRYYWIEPGHSLMVTVENDMANAKSYGDVSWIEGI